MKKDEQPAPETDTRSRVEQAEARAEKAESRTEQAETRTEQAKTRAEHAETRTEQAETRADQAESALQRVIQNETQAGPEIAKQLLKPFPDNAVTDGKNPLEKLTDRQREILRLIAEGQNTKSIADLLNVSPKTVEYHRMKLMAELDLHDIPGLVRFALRVGLIPPES